MVTLFENKDKISYGLVHCQASAAVCRGTCLLDSVEIQTGVAISWQVISQN